MRIDPATGLVRLGGRTSTFDRLIAAASAVAGSVLHDPIGGARLPEPGSPMGETPQFATTAPSAAEAYALGYHIVSSARGRTA